LQPFRRESNAFPRDSGDHLMRIRVFESTQNPEKDHTPTRVSKSTAERLLREFQNGQPLYVRINKTAIQVARKIERAASGQRSQPVIVVSTYSYPEMTRIAETPANRYPRLLVQRRRGNHGYSWERPNKVLALNSPTG
jgi:hypothetical protein